MNDLMPPLAPVVQFSSDALDTFMPLHILLDEDRTIIGSGRCWARMELDYEIVGRRFENIFSLRRPRRKAPLDDLSALSGATLHLRLKEPPNTALRGVMMPAGERQWLVNMSFGIDAAKAVEAHDLTIEDFAPTDLTVELLYLIEAHALSRTVSRNLIRRLETSKHEAVARSLTDPLTGVGNRRALQWAFERQLRRTDGTGLILLDLDQFKALNDRLGHAAGDHMLTIVADRLREETRQGDFVARVGGDEFVVMVSGRSGGDALKLFAERLIERISEPADFRGQTCQIGASAGCVLTKTFTGKEPERVIEAADRALYAAKRAGKGMARLVYFDAEGDASEELAE